MTLEEALEMLSMSYQTALDIAIVRESNGNHFALGDYEDGEPTAFGPLQIRSKVLDDLRNPELPELNAGWQVDLSDCFEIHGAISIFQGYTNGWSMRLQKAYPRERFDSREQTLRLWNGGPAAINTHDPNHVIQLRATDQYIIDCAQIAKRLDDHVNKWTKQTGSTGG